MSSPRAGPSGIRTARGGPVVVSDITLRPTDSNDTVAREIKAALSMPEVAIGRYKSRRNADKTETAGNVIRATVDPNESTPLVVPVPEGNRGLTLEMCARISRRLKWVGVSQDIFRYTTGRLEYITSDEAPLVGDQIIDCPYPTQVLHQGASYMETGDIRGLTLKVALMDMQRERCFSQPSGVEWAWARPNMPQRYFIDLSSLGHWHYDAIFVNREAIEYALQNDGRLPVGSEGDYWNVLAQSAITIIGLSSNTGAYNMGRTAWILAHLTYPLAWVLEYFDMARLGKDASMDEVFCHTAGLVDIRSNVRHLIFVIPTKTETSVSIGGKSFPIGTVDHHMELSDNRRPQEWNVDEQISVMLREALNSRNSLRRDFEKYIRPMIPDGINWLEVDSIINLLTVRYHQRVEGVCHARDEDTTYVGAPRGSLMSMGLRPAQHVTDESYPDYGAVNAVTALDQRVCSQECARQNPILLIGSWNNYAEICITTGLAYYSLHNTENAQDVSYRLLAGNLDKLQRSRALRAALELWKKRLLLLDIVAFPVDAWKHEWPELIQSRRYRPTASCVLDLANAIIGPIVRYSWNVNAVLGANGSTITGQRLCSGQWRHDYNVGYVPYDPNGESGEGSGKAKYFLDNSIHSWAYDKLHQGYTLGDTCYGLEYAMSRINLTDNAWDVTYRDQKSGCESPGASFCVDSSWGAILASELGIRDPADPRPPPKTWIWGITRCC